MNNRRRVGGGGGTFGGIVQSNEILTPRSTGHQQPYQDHNYYSRTGLGLSQAWTNGPSGKTRRTFESTDVRDAMEETPREEQYYGKAETGVSLDT